MRQIISLFCLALLTIASVYSCKKDAPTSVVGQTYSISTELELSEEEGTVHMSISISFPTSARYTTTIEFTDNLGQLNQITNSGPYTISSDLITCLPEANSMVRKINGAIVPIKEDEELEPVENTFKIGEGYESIILLDEDNSSVMVFKRKK